MYYTISVIVIHVLPYTSVVHYLDYSVSRWNSDSIKKNWENIIRQGMLWTDPAGIHTCTFTYKFCTTSSYSPYIITYKVLPWANNQIYILLHYICIHIVVDSGFWLWVFPKKAVQRLLLCRVETATTEAISSLLQECNFYMLQEYSVRCFKGVDLFIVSFVQAKWSICIFMVFCIFCSVACVMVAIVHVSSKFIISSFCMYRVGVLG